MPPGVPAGGIFKQVAARSASGTFGVLALDPVAADLSLPSTGSGSAAGVAAAVYGGQPTSLAAQAAAITLSDSLVHPKLKSWSKSALNAVPTVIVITTGQERAKLPDVAALVTDHVPEYPSSDAAGFAIAKLADGSMLEPTPSSLSVDALVASRGVAGTVGPGETTTKKTERGESQIPAALAIYSATCLTVGVSAPGLTSVIRGGKWRNKLRLPGGSVELAHGWPR
jgi:hypothetical protein